MSFLLQAIGCYCYWDMHSIKLSEHVHAGRHNRVCTECSVAWVASSSPGIGERAGVGRGWRIDGDGWLAWEGGRIRGWVVGQISSLQLWRRNKLIWQWQMNHLLFPNCQFYFSQTTFPPPVFFPIPPLFSFQKPSNLIFFIFNHQLFFTPFLLWLYWWSFSLWRSLTSLLPIIIIKKTSPNSSRQLLLPWFCFMS